MDAEHVGQTSVRRDYTPPSLGADPRAEFAAVLDELELQVHEDIMMLDGPIGHLLAPHLVAAIGASTDSLVDALSRTRKTLKATDSTTTEAAGSQGAGSASDPGS
jgi:hypothetical protein